MSSPYSCYYQWLYAKVKVSVLEYLSYRLFEDVHYKFPFLKTYFPKQMRYAEHIKIHNEIHEFSELMRN